MIRCSEWISSSCFTNGTCRVTVKRQGHDVLVVIRKSCWTPVYVNDTNYLNPYKTKGSKDDLNIVSTIDNKSYFLFYKIIIMSLYTQFYYISVIT